MSRCPRWRVERDTLVQASAMHLLRSYNVCGEVTYTCCFGYSHRKKSNGVKSGESEHRHTQLFDRYDGMPTHKKSSMKNYIVRNL
ncbi:hypothetical protein TNCV_4977851 [Trichonephila clavipes]|nr:hypothetical protein TNCV_4977851 [Trichonephila clavipes]